MAKDENIPKTKAPEIEVLIERFKSAQLKPGDAELIERLLRTVIMLLDLLERKNLSIKKLRAMIFGLRTEKRPTTGGADEEKSAVSEEKKSESPPSASEQESGRLVEQSESAERGEKPRRKGHGRRAASDYKGTRFIPSSSVGSATYNSPIFLQPEISISEREAHETRFICGTSLACRAHRAGC
jgi:hypothetical protein